jgi:protocatechuate 3,4-dioxygenase beta subunit
MKALSLLLLLGAALAAQQPASIEGTVVNDTDGRPVSGAHIALRSTRMPMAQTEYAAMSDANGHFSMAAVQPGSYILMPQRNGLVFASVGGRGAPLPTIRVRAGQHLANYIVHFAVKAVITGRVVDEAGDPVPGVNVEPSRTGQFADLVPSARWGGWGTAFDHSDDRGEFRIVVPPGKYYLYARPRDTRPGDAPEIRTDGSADIVYGETYYPNAAGPDRATAIDAVAGRETTGIEIRLVREQFLSVGGMITGPDGPMVATVWLKSPVNRQINRGVVSDADGHFSFNRVQAGSYQLYAQGAEKKSLQSPVLELRVEGADHNDVHLALSPGGDLSGSLEIAGGLGGKHTVRLGTEGQSSGNAGEVAGGAVDDQGRFQLANIPPGRYRILVDPLPDDAYLKSISVNGTVARDDLIDLTAGAHGARVQASFGRNGPRISGTLRDDSGEVLAEDYGPIEVQLIRDGDPDHPIMLNPQGGKYLVQSIRPGKYRIVALDLFNFPPRDALMSLGEEVELHEGDRITKDLKVITREAADAKK